MTGIRTERDGSSGGWDHGLYLNGKPPSESEVEQKVWPDFTIARSGVVARQHTHTHTQRTQSRV